MSLIKNKKMLLVTLLIFVIVGSLFGLYVKQNQKSELTKPETNVNYSVNSKIDTTGNSISTSANSLLTNSNSLPSVTSTSSLMSKQSETNTQKLNEFTNQYLPSLKLKYPETWKLDTTTSTSKRYSTLLDRQIKLSKDGVDLVISLQTGYVTGCSGAPEEKLYKVIEHTKLSNNIYKTLTEGDVGFGVVPKIGSYTHFSLFETPALGCLLNLIESNIPASDYPDYGLDLGAPNRKVKFFINVETIETKPNDATYKEAVEIMNRSQF